MKRLVVVAICWIVFAPVAAGQAPVTSAPEPRLGATPGVHQSVARIVAPGEGSVSYGSGTLVWANDTHGLVVTNWHVVNEATQPISVHFPDGFYSLGIVQKVDRDWDLALIAIRKPNAVPVPLANSAPRRGDPLTIAGYGSGSYRAVTGACTQYVAPGESFPFEMVELAASARQGDSGGPIFNARGELAGVLFGEGHGRTSGSYCGRVKWFLSSVVPPTEPDFRQIATAPLKPVSPRPIATAAASETYQIGPAPIVRTAMPGPPSAASGELSTVGVVASTRAGPPVVAQAQTLGWEDVAGSTLAEQCKSVLAAIGVLAVILHALRWMSRERATA